jgi:hypothetical protein
MATAWERVRHVASLSLLQTTRLRDRQEQKLAELKERRLYAAGAVINREPPYGNSSPELEELVELNHKIARIEGARDELNEAIGVIAGIFVLGVELDRPEQDAQPKPALAAKRSRPDYDTIKNVVRELGNLTDDELWPAVCEQLPGALRKHVRDAHVELYGPRRPGRRPNK